MNLAAVWEMILNCEWGRIWWGITHAHWANVWAAISAIFTTLAVIVAGWAMLRWRKQDELKAKQDFKKAISVYSDYLAQVPDTLSERGLLSSGTKLDELTSRYIACVHAWMGTEGLLDGNNTVADSWKKIAKGQSDYLQGKCSAMDINDNCYKIMQEKFVFK